MLAKALQEVVNFIRAKSEKLKIFNWTDEEIAAYFLEKSKERQVIVLYKGNEPSGVVFFNLLSEHYMYIEQLWSSDKKATKAFLQILVDNFPFVTHLSFFHQRRKRPYTITVKNFIRIYG
jgi:hypothetical protein